jgi:hypothetical protein
MSTVACFTTPGVSVRWSSFVVLIIVFTFVISIIVESHNAISRFRIFQELRHMLLAFQQNLDEIRSKIRIFIMVVERSGKALVPDTGGAS